MLTRLHIKNIALISEADIEFDGGLNVLSGETGSGKSVILDSINFVLGSKADKTMIRFGEQEASVRAEFSVDLQSEAVRALDELDIETDGTIIISRKFSADGRGNIKVNGNAVTASMLKSVTSHLVDVHGQSEHFFLLSEENQLKVIDGICGSECELLKNDIRGLIAKKRELKAEIARLGGSEEERERRLGLLSYQIDEIERAGVTVGEYDELKEKQTLIANTEKILSAIDAVCGLLNGDGGAADGIFSAVRYMSSIAALNEKYSEVLDRLESLGAEATDIAETLSDFKDELNFDEGEAQAVDERISLLNGLKKKYGGDEEGILEFLKNAKEEFEAISDSATLIEKYGGQIEDCDKKIYDLCKKLTQLRKSAAVKFCADVTGELKTLNIADARFEVDFKDYDQSTAELNSANGSDKISFAFSANKGEPLKPLNKVISGGEMSRFMLAIKTCLKDLNGISTYIFDEIDAGISGYTANTVAEKFQKIAQNTQILAVSHLPQVCAASSAQFLIYKTEENGKTLTKVKRLSADEKVDEIVRLTGNVESAAARQHAEELIARFSK